MVNYSRRNRWVATIGALLMATNAMWAQESSPSSSGTAQPSTSTASGNTSGVGGASPSPGPTAPNNGAAQSALDYLYNRKPQEGSAAGTLQRGNQQAEGKMLAAEATDEGIGLDADTEGRFERYLGAQEVPADEVKAYLAAVERVHEELKTKRPVYALGKLVELTEYEDLDAGVSYELANRIESIWNLDKAIVRLEQQNTSLRENINTMNRSADMMSDRIRNDEIAYQRKLDRSSSHDKNQGDTKGGVPGQAPYPSEGGTAMPSGSEMMATLGGKLRLTEEYLRSMEAKARIKMNEMRMSELDEKAKENFARYIGTLFQSKRYLHVILAADFYRRIFNDSEYPVDLTNQVNASLEIMQDLESTVEVFRYKVQKGEIANAAERLQEAFVLGETHPLVLGIERRHKERVGDFAAKLSKMRNLIEAREFGDLEGLLDEMQASASDFDATKARAIVNAVKLESRLRLGKAKIAAQKGNLDLAMQEFQAAAQAWPANPELESSANQFFDTNDMQNQSLTDFDRDFENENFRKIYEKQLAYAPAIKGDKNREEKLRSALEKVQKAEMAIEKAKILQRNGDHFGAWETVELAAEDWPDDRELNKLRADLSGRSAEFVAAINRAEDAEARGDWGYSLTWYLNAQRRYPASRISNEAIERLSQRILKPGASVPSTSTGETPDDDAGHGEA